MSPIERDLEVVGLSMDQVWWDTQGWRLAESASDHQRWVTAAGDTACCRIFLRDWEHRCIEDWRRKGRKEAEELGGAAVSIRSERVDGVEVFRGVFKFPASRVIRSAPTDGLAVFALGLVVIPFAGFYFEIHVQARDRGEPGAREAAAGLQDWLPNFVFAPGRARSEGDVEFARRTLSRPLPTDDTAHDSLAPDHPLSRVRATHQRLVGTMRIHEGLRARPRRS